MKTKLTSLALAFALASVALGKASSQSIRESNWLPAPKGPFFTVLRMPGWNYTVRLYRPRAEILNGKWKFPEAQPQ